MSETKLFFLFSNILFLAKGRANFFRLFLTFSVGGPREGQNPTNLKRVVSTVSL